MEFITLVIALVALILAISAYKAPYFEPRFQIYEELVTVFSELLTLDFNAEQLELIDHLILRAKFLYSYDQDVLTTLNKTREYIAYALEHSTEDSQPEPESKKTQEMIRWIEQITNKHYTEDEKSELDRIFDRYLKVSLLVEIPPIIKELALRSIEFIKQLVGKLKINQPKN